MSATNSAPQSFIRRYGRELAVVIWCIVAFAEGTCLTAERVLPRPLTETAAWIIVAIEVIVCLPLAAVGVWLPIQGTPSSRPLFAQSNIVPVILWVLSFGSLGVFAGICLFSVPPISLVWTIMTAITGLLGVFAGLAGVVLYVSKPK